MSDCCNYECNRGCRRGRMNRCNCQTKQNQCGEQAYQKTMCPVEEAVWNNSCARENSCCRTKTKGACNVSNSTGCKGVDESKCYHLQEDLVGCMPLAMAYVPWQQWQSVYEADCGLAAGTIFEELAKPFVAGCQGGM